MVTRNDTRPFHPQHPGFILKAELKERGIKQKDFAEQVGLRASHLSSLLHGARNISPQLAKRIESILHIPARVWLNLQDNFNLDTLRTSELVDGYETTPTPTLAFGEPSAEELELWRRAFRAGQNDYAAKVRKRMEEMGLSSDQIKQATCFND